MSELAEREQVSKSSLTRIAARLEEGGYLDRSTDPEDRRGSLISLTEAGGEVLRAASERQDAYLNRQLDALDSADRQRLLAAVRAIEMLLELRL